jgi:hypothetical protein
MIIYAIIVFDWLHLWLIKWGDIHVTALNLGYVGQADVLYR